MLPWEHTAGQPQWLGKTPNGCQGTVLSGYWFVCTDPVQLYAHVCVCVRERHESESEGKTDRQTYRQRVREREVQKDQDWGKCEYILRG